MFLCFFFFFSSRRRHTRSTRDWSSDVCSSDLALRDVTIAQLENHCSLLNPTVYSRCRHVVTENERRSEEHTSELQSRVDLVCRLLLEKKKRIRSKIWIP